MAVFRKGKDKLKAPSIAEVEGAVTTVEEICERARDGIMAAVQRHYQKHPNSPWSGVALLELERTLRELYSSWGVDIKDEFRQSLPAVMQRFYESAKEACARDGKRRAIIGKPDEKRIQYFLDSTYKQVAMRTDKMEFDHIRQLRQISADVLRETSMTGATRREVSKKMLDRATQIRGFQFIDRAGRRWPDKSYFEMLARTELMNAGRASYDQTCAEDGYDVMLLTVSGDSCEHCRKWEGRCFSLTGATKGLPTKADLEAEGVFHPNCTHSYSAVPDYIWRTQYNPDGSKRDREVEYTPSDEELSRLKELDRQQEAIDAERKAETVDDRIQAQEELKRKLDSYELPDLSEIKETPDEKAEYERKQREYADAQVWLEGHVMSSGKEISRHMGIIREIEIWMDKYRVNKALKMFGKPDPSSFMIGGGATGRLKTAAQNALDVFNRIVSSNVVSDSGVINVNAAPSGENREYFSHEEDSVFAFGRTATSTFLHEYAHWLERHNPRIRQMCIDFLEMRCKGESKVFLKDIYPKSKYKAWETCRKDKFIDAYTGKDYIDDATHDRYATEILSTGVERLMTSPVDFYKKDRQHATFTIMALSGAL